MRSLRTDLQIHQTSVKHCISGGLLTYVAVLTIGGFAKKMDDARMNDCIKCGSILEIFMNTVQFFTTGESMLTIYSTRLSRL